MIGSVVCRKLLEIGARHRRGDCSKGEKRRQQNVHPIDHNRGNNPFDKEIPGEQEGTLKGLRTERIMPFYLDIDMMSFTSSTPEKTGQMESNSIP